MHKVDDAILEFYEELDGSTEFRIALPPMAVYVNLVEKLEILDKSSTTISRRMQRLADMGLLKKSDSKRGYYQITDKWIYYLQDNLDTDDLPRPRDD